MARPAETLHAPHLIDLEVVQALRRLVRVGVMGDDRARAALEIFAQIRLVRHRHDALLDRVWAMRENLTAYDAVYVVLAESLDAPLVTCDARLARARAHRARVEVIGRG